MKNFLAALFVLTLFSCKDKNSTEDNTNFFPVLPYLKSEVAHIDTSLYRIMKIEVKNNVADTSYIKREQFREYAKDFLTIPDISSKKWRDDYTETELFDQELQSVVLNYTPKENDLEITRQEVMITPDQNEGDKVNTIFIDRNLEKDDALIQKRMTWYINKRFEIVTITSKPNTPEKVETLKLVWNDFSAEE